MNCEKCGAPMKIDAGQDVFHCDYCGSYAFADPNQDGVVLLDQPSNYACPICGRTLVTAVVNDIHIFSCPNCRGNLIRQAQIHPILSRTQTSAAGQADPPDPGAASELKRKIACPSCQKIMEAYPYGGAECIFIQGCARCGLVWLDFGELSGIVRSYARTKAREGFASEGLEAGGRPNPRF